MEMRMPVWWQSAPRWFEAVSPEIPRLYRPSLSLLELASRLVAALAVALGFWRIGADIGWTNSFFIADGLLSHWQTWFALAIGVRFSASNLNRWIAHENHNDAGSKGLL